MNNAKLSNNNLFIEVSKVSKKSWGFRLIRLSIAVFLGKLGRILYPPRKPRMPSLPSNRVVHPLVRPALKELLSKRSISERTIRLIANSLALKNTHLSQLFQYQKVAYEVSSLLSQLPNPNTCKERYIAIPLAVKVLGIFKHWVLIIVDKQSDTLEFYDSLGLTLSDYNKTFLYSPKHGASLTLQALLNIVLELYGTKKTEILENKKVHQKDSINCALFMLDRLYMRCVNELSFSKAQESAPCTYKAFSHIRELFMNLLLNHKPL